MFSVPKQSQVKSDAVEMSLVSDVKRIEKNFSDVFKSRDSPIKNFTVTLRLKEGSVPKFRKASVVPFSLRGEVETQIEGMLSRGIIERVKFSDWASQVVLAKKKNERIRLCCNYKNTLNPNLEKYEYPIPNVDDILFTLNGNSFFTLIDLSGAYLQLALDENSSKLTTINTHVGLLSYRRLPFGVKTAPAIFQEVIDKILSGLENVVSYFDDILVGSPTKEGCVKNTFAVLSRLREFNVQANFENFLSQVLSI